MGVRAHRLLAAAMVQELDVVGVDFQPHVRLALWIGPRLRLRRTLHGHGAAHFQVLAYSQGVSAPDDALDEVDFSPLLRAAMRMSITRVDLPATCLLCHAEIPGGIMLLNEAGCPAFACSRVARTIFVQLTFRDFRCRIHNIWHSALLHDPGMVDCMWQC